MPTLSSTIDYRTLYPPHKTATELCLPACLSDCLSVSSLWFWFSLSFFLFLSFPPFLPLPPLEIKKEIKANMFLFVCLSVCLSVCLCLSVWLYVCECVQVTLPVLTTIAPSTNPASDTVRLTAYLFQKMLVIMATEREQTVKTWTPTSATISTTATCAAENAPKPAPICHVSVTRCFIHEDHMSFWLEIQKERILIMN